MITETLVKSPMASRVMWNLFVNENKSSKHVGGCERTLSIVGSNSFGKKYSMKMTYNATRDRTQGLP